MHTILIGNSVNFLITGAHPCPVCGYGLSKLPADFTICPSCGVEFGYSDAGVSHRDLRLEWISGGAPWSSVVVQRPYGWNPWEQLIRANLSYDVPWHGGFALSASTGREWMPLGNNGVEQWFGGHAGPLFYAYSFGQAPTQTGVYSDHSETFIYPRDLSDQGAFVSDSSPSDQELKVA